MSDKNYAALAAPYEKSVGKVTFVVSSFSNANTTVTAEDMLLDMIKDHINDEEVDDNDRK